MTGGGNKETSWKTFKSNMEFYTGGCSGQEANEKHESGGEVFPHTSYKRLFWT